MYYSDKRGATSTSDVAYLNHIPFTYRLDLFQWNSFVCEMGVAEVCHTWRASSIFALIISYSSYVHLAPPIIDKNGQRDMLLSVSPKSGAKIRPHVLAMDGSDLNRSMDDSNLYAIYMRSDSIRAICAVMNGWIDWSAPAR